MVEKFEAVLSTKNESDDWPFSSSEKIAYTFSFVFDPSVKVVWKALSRGASLVIAWKGALTDMTYLHQLVHNNLVTLFDCVPSVLSTYIATTVDTPFPSSLRHILLGGEALPCTQHCVHAPG